MSLLRRTVRRTGPLRVMYVVPDLEVGGAERHVTTLLPAMNRTRFEPSVVCIGRQGALFPALAAGGVSARALNRAKSQSVGALIELVREMRRVRPDVVITRGYSAEILGRVAAVLTRVPVSVVWVHHCGDLTPRARMRRMLDRLLDPITTAYYGVAHGQVPYLSGELGYPVSKIRVIRNGTDPTAVTPHPAQRRDRRSAASWGIGAHDPVFGMLAVLRPEKDHTTLLRAARLVIDQIPDARVLIVGDGPLRPELSRHASELGITDRVIFTGARHDTAELIQLMDVFVLTSFTVECFPMALLEAMAAGRPAVCTSVGGVPEMIQEGVTGHLVPPRDPHALAERLIPLLRDRARAAAMGRAARARLESEFTLRASVHTAQRTIEQSAGRFCPVRPIRLTLVLDLTFVGGAEILLLNLFRQFDPAVVRPRVVCLREAGDLAGEFRASGIPVEVLHRTGRYDLRTLPRLVASLRQDDTDVVLVTHHHRAALTLGRLAARLAGVPANVLAAHGMDLTAVGKRCLPRHVVETLFLSSALILLAPSQRRYLRREEGVGRLPWRRVPEVVIPNGIPLPPVPSPRERAAARATLGLEPDDFVVGVVARLSAEKAHEVLFEAVAQLVPTHPRLRLVVIGDGLRGPELRFLAAELGIADRVRFTGSRRDVPALLPGLDVSCLSSVHEGAPITVIESMAAGLPVVATSCGALRDMVADGEEGFLVPVGDSPALADRIARLATDDELRERLGTNGRVRAEREYRIETTAQGYERLLTSLVARR